VTAALVAGLLAGFGIAIPVGPVATYLVLLTARTSWRTGAAAALGVATVDGGYALLAVLGGSAVATAVVPVLDVLRWVSVAVLALLAVRTAMSGLRTASAPDAATPTSPGRAYSTFVGLTAVNPTTVVYFVALVVGLNAGTGPAEHAVFVMAAFAASACWQLVVAGSGVVLGRAVTGPRGRRITAVVSGLVMLLLAARIVVG